MSEQSFRLPDLGEGLTEAEVVRWLVAAGETVVVDQPIIEVETAKATVELPSPYGGTVTALRVAEGEVVDVGAVLLDIDPAPVSEAGAEAEPATVGVVRDHQRGGGSEAGSGNVLVGYGTAERGRRRTGRRRGSAAVPKAAGRPLVISPVVRRLAKEHGVDLRALDGSAAGGVITRADVERAIAAARVGVGARCAGSDVEVGVGARCAGSDVEVGVGARCAGSDVEVGAPWWRNRAEAAGAGSDVDVPAVSRWPLPVRDRVALTGVRRAAAEAFTRSRREIPEATTWVDVDATGLVEIRREINAQNPEAPVGLLALIARFVVTGLARHPEMNSRVDLDAGEIVRFDGVNLGFAAQTERGLVVPVVHDAHRLSARGLHGELGRLTEAARSGGLGVADLTGGTFTLNNYGVFGVDGSAPIINHPEVAILGVGRIIDRPWVVDGELVVRKVVQLSLAFDHRVCDGSPPAAFLRFVADCMERPREALADI